MQERAVITRQALIAAAADVFAQKGFAATTMADILAAADSSKGALYFHFRSKEELAHAIFNEDLRFADASALSSGSPLQDLIDLSHRFAASLRSDPVARASVRLAVELTFQPGEEPTGYGTWQQTTTRLLEAANQHGELAEGISPQAAANVIVGSFTGLQLLSEARSHREDLWATLVDWWRMLVPGVASPLVVSRLQVDGSENARPELVTAPEAPA